MSKSIENSSGRISVSVVIPTYNRAQSVCEAIDSVLAQIPAPHELIVVNDGSTDNTSELLGEYGDRISVLHQENSGAGVARNAGVKYATGEWVAFLDSDDLWLPGRLAALHRDLASSSNDIVGHTGDMRLTGLGYDLEVFNQRGWKFPENRAERIDCPLAQAIAGIHPPVTALRRDCVLEEGGFNTDRRIYEDPPLFCALALRGPWLFTGDVLAEARRLPGDNDAISTLERTHEVESATARLAYISELLERNLSADQRILVMTRASGAQLMLAAAEAAESIGSHRRTAIASARQHPSAIKGWLKALPPLVLGRRGYRISLRGHKAFTRS